MLPELIYYADDDGVYLNIFEQSLVKMNISGISAQISQKTDYPFKNSISISISLEKEINFPLYIRIPEWMMANKMVVNLKDLTINTKDNYICLQRKWQEKNTIDLGFEVKTELIKFKEFGYALKRGCDILSVNASDNPNINLDSIYITDKSINLESMGAEEGVAYYYSSIKNGDKNKSILFRNFADAGNSNSEFKTIFPLY